MDASVRKKVNDIIRQLDSEGLSISMADPIAKMMLVALAHETDRIERKIDTSLEQVSEKFVNKVLSNSGIAPQPAISLLKIGNGKEYSSYMVDEKVAFTQKPSKCNFRPLLPTRIVPGNLIAYYANGKLYFPYENIVSIQHGEVVHPNELWIAYETAGELESLSDLTFAINHPLPRNLTASVGKRSFDLCPLIEDDYYSIGNDMMLIEYWKRNLIFHRLWIYRFVDDGSDMPLITSSMPEWFYDMYDAETLSRLTSKRLVWIKITATNSFDIPSDSTIEFNCVPVANFDINTVKLSYTEPIKLVDNPKNSSQFYSVVPDDALVNEFFIRDFDVEQYDNTRIADDIQNLYRHYVDDYFAFIDNNSLTDGVVLRNLRMSMLQVTDALPEVQENARPYVGTYIIRTPHNNNLPIAVSYITTQGMRGNALKAGDKLYSSLTATGNVIALIDAKCGRDKMSGRIGKRELARLIVNSNCRIYSEIDLLQYCKVELIRALGDDALKYCNLFIYKTTMPIVKHIDKVMVLTINIVSEQLYSQAEYLNLSFFLETNIQIRSSLASKVIVKLKLIE